ncbi:protein KBP homolog [Scaptodrosophila lebanonensis]|uniref:KIF-binding protein n=1 Tax=Drosophila lebanonensis TaxID=7225 RepID=A0A6J2U1N4_DROLE|nr:protein KBP homolog [Scaptodrosophila lebanonensis]
MVNLKAILDDIKKLYGNIDSFLQTDQFDETDPFKSYYNSCDLLIDMKNQLDSELGSIRDQGNGADEAEFRLNTLLACVCRDLGRIYIHIGSDSDGEQMLQQCIDLIEPQKLTAEGIIPYIGATIELSISRAFQKEFECAIKLLLKAVDGYKMFQLNGNLAMDIADLYNPPKLEVLAVGPAELNNLHIMAFYYLGQIYNEMGQLEKASEFCHETLNLHRKFKLYDSLEFSLNATTLSYYYVEKERFKVARTLLAVGIVTLEQLKLQLAKPPMPMKLGGNKPETYKSYYAKIARCWALYGLKLLNSSKLRLLDNDTDDSDDSDMQAIVSATKHLQLTISDEDHIFSHLDLSVYENSISCNYCLSFDDAKLVFDFATKWLERAKDHFKSKSDKTDYLELILDYAEGCKNIAYFDENTETQIQMGMRGVQYIEDVLEMLDPQLCLKFCRICWYEAGLLYSTLLDDHLHNMDPISNNPSPDEIKNVNESCLNGIKHLEAFIKSYKEAPELDAKWFEDMDLEGEHNMLYAHLYLGRFYSKLICNDRKKELENIQTSQKLYQRFTHEINKRPAVAEILRPEMGVAREMLQLLQLKIQILSLYLRALDGAHSSNA